MGSYLVFGLCQNILQKMCITITDIVGKKRIDLAYPINNFNSNKQVANVSVFSDNIRYKFTEPWALKLEELRTK